MKHIGARKVKVSIQDFCNILGGGLVSYSTLSAQTIQQLCTMSNGVVICSYHYDPADYIDPEGTQQTYAEDDKPKEEIKLGSTNVSKGPREGNYQFHAICWKGTSKTINVMCSRIDIDFMKHQLQVLNVLRPKIAVKREDAATANTEGAAEEAQPETVEEVQPTPMEV